MDEFDKDFKDFGNDEDEASVDLNIVDEEGLDENKTVPGKLDDSEEDFLEGDFGGRFSF